MESSLGDIIGKYDIGQQELMLPFKITDSKIIKSTELLFKSCIRIFCLYSDGFTSFVKTFTGFRVTSDGFLTTIDASLLKQKNESDKVFLLKEIRATSSRITDALYCLEQFQAKESDPNMFSLEVSMVESKLALAFLTVSPHEKGEIPKDIVISAPKNPSSKPWYMVGYFDYITINDFAKQSSFNNQNTIEQLYNEITIGMGFENKSLIVLDLETKLKSIPFLLSGFEGSPIFGYDKDQNLQDNYSSFGAIYVGKEKGWVTISQPGFSEFYSKIIFKNIQN